MQTWTDARLKYLREIITELDDEELRCELSLTDEDLDPDNPNNIELFRRKLEEALKR